MTVSLDRQISKFQAKVQQELTLKDDEIERLKHDIVQTNAEIAQIEDQINIEKDKYNHQEAKVVGKERKQKASIETIKTRLNTSHSERIYQITQQQSEVINEIHQEFETKLAQIEQYSDALTQQRTKGITDEIKKTKEMIDKVKQKISDQEKRGHSDTEDEIMENQEIEINRVKALENALKDKNKERYESLMSAKQQLSQCVTTLEESEKEHRINLDNLLQKLRQLDEKYKDRLKRMKDAHEREIEPLKRRKSEVEKRISAAMRQMDSMDAQHRRQIESVVTQGEQLKLEYQNAITKGAQLQQEDDKIRTQTQKLQQLTQTLEQRDKQLAEVRQQNESMKREVMRLKHEAKVAKRRAHLNI